MVFFETEEQARLKRLKIEQAVNFAMQSRWGEAADLNRQLIDAYPKELEAYNRLGKALMELAKYDEARESYNHALRLEPTNGIAQKNLLRLSTLMAEDVAPVSAAPIDPSLFIAETGRATITSLVEPAPSEVLATADAGDPVTLEIQANTVNVLNGNGDFLGKIEPKLRQRLIRLTKMGNQYGAFVTAVDERTLRVIIRETHRDPSMGNRPSFPTTGDLFRGYTRESMVRFDAEEEEEEEDEEEGLEHEREPHLEPEAEMPHEVLLGDEPPPMVHLADEEEEEP